MQSKSVVWLDRKEARIFKFSNESMERKVIHARIHDHHTHRIDDQLEKEAPTFYREIAEHLRGTGGILIMGPGVAKTHFETYLKSHAPLVAGCIVGRETVDHPTDPQIAAFAARYFMQKEIVS